MEKLDQTIFYKLEKTIKIYRQFAQGQIREAGYSITIDQWLTMKKILENPGIKQQELAENVFKDNASITRIITLLVVAKYVKREVHKEDRRRTALTVTRKGQEMVENVSKVIGENRKQALKGINKKDLEFVDKNLGTIAENCQK